MGLAWWDKKRLTVKILIGAVLLWGVPIIVISNLAFHHLRTIESVTLRKARNALIASQVDFLKHHLVLQAEKISTEFSNIKKETRLLSTFAQPLVQYPRRFRYRNGSHYRFDAEGDYGNPVDDGHSRLWVPHYTPALDPLIRSTESLDIPLKALARSEPLLVLGWIISKKGISRTYPWRDFKLFPRDRDVTDWSFFFLADPQHDPSRKPLFTPLYTDPLSRDTMISCLCPVYVRNRQVATVGIDITVQKIIQDLSQVRLTKNSSTLLLSNNEVLAASKNLPLAALGLDPRFSPEGLHLADADLSRVGQEVLRDRKQKIGVDLIENDKLHAFVGYASLAPLGWRLVLLVPEADLVGPANEKVRAILEQTRRIRGNFLHILIFALLALASLSYVVIVHQSRGLRTLLGGIREFAKGHLDHRLREERTEFGQLAHALNHMAESLLEKKGELQRAYAEVEQGRRLTAVGRLAAGVAHEVNNPLATISTYTQLLLRSDLPTEASASLEKVMREIARIQEKLRNLLDLSRLQSPVKKRVRANALVREVADLACHEALARGIELRLCLEAGEGELCLDQSGFKQVLWNLLSNALAAQGPGGEVCITTRFVAAEGKVGRVFELEVQDAGPGIPKKVLPHIFDAFFTTKEVGQGTGLGLAVVSSIVQGHDGRIEVANLNPRGCRFRVRLPVEGEI